MALRDPATRDWLDAESGVLHVLARELQRLKQRAKRQPFRILLAALALSGLAMLQVGRRADAYDARVILRIDEGALDQSFQNLPVRELVDYIWSVSLSSENLLTVMKELELLPANVSPTFAVGEFRDPLRIEVFRNYFLDYKGAERSARVGIYYRDSDPEQAFRIAKRLALLIIDSETTRRRAVTSRAVDDITAAVERARERLRAREHQLDTRRRARADALAAGDASQVARLRMEMTQQQGLLDAEVETLDALEANRAVAEEVRDAELADLGMRFMIIDERRPTIDEDARWHKLATVGLVCFLLLVPALSIMFGAFDTRLHDPEDIERLGLATVGHIPSFAGDTIGSLDQRRKHKHRDDQR